MANNLIISPQRKLADRILNRDGYLLECVKYEDYLDTLITLNDVKYVRNVYHLRDLVKLGYTTTQVLTPEQYEQKRRVVKEILFPTKQSCKIFSKNLLLIDPVLLELQMREIPNIQKTLSTIIYVCYKLKSGYEISSYIDYAQSLHDANNNEKNALDWDNIFNSKKIIKPRVTDLSYVDWKKYETKSNDSDNYKIVNSGTYGLCFMFKGDRKLISTESDPHPDLIDNYTKTLVYSPKFGFVVFLDHVIRRKY